MLSLFQNNKKQKVVVEDMAQDRIAKYIVGRFLRLQQHWATFMQRHTERLTVKRKVMMLFLFCLCGAGFSFLLIAKGFMSNNIPSLQVTQFRSLKHLGKSGDEKTKATLIVTKEEYEKIQRFRLYMDSLNTSSKKLRDSLLINRPGLMDSIMLIINIYQSQNKK
ncbi:MAG TPA: hypothetical protein VF610_08460 [Segetibacter sp.]|jgi:hypothetical protein